MELKLGFIEFNVFGCGEVALGVCGMHRGSVKPVLVMVAVVFQGLSLWYRLKPHLWCFVR